MTLILENLNIGRYMGQPLFISPFSDIFEGPALILIIGRSGAGKTTFLLTLAQILHPLQGSIFELTNGNNEDKIIDDISLAKEHKISLNKIPWKANGRYNLAFQNPENLFFMTTVKEELAFSLIQSKFTMEEIEKKCAEWLLFWGIDPKYFLNKSPFQLSGGEKRKIALASVTINTKELILFDEPLAGLDHQSTINVVNSIVNLAKKSLVFVVTHDVEPFLKYSKKIIVFKPCVSHKVLYSESFNKCNLLEKDANYFEKNTKGFNNNYQNETTNLKNFNEITNCCFGKTIINHSEYTSFPKLCEHEVSDKGENENEDVDKRETTIDYQVFPLSFNNYKEFLFACLKDESIYPLPDWYKEVVHKYNLSNQIDSIPNISPKEIIETLNQNKILR